MSEEEKKPKKPGAKPGSKKPVNSGKKAGTKIKPRKPANVKVPKISSKSLSLKEVLELNTQMYNNRKYFMNLYDKYGQYDYNKLKDLVDQIDEGKAKLSVYEVSVVRLFADMTANRKFSESPDRYANIFASMLQFLAGDLSSGVDYKSKIQPKDILSSYKEFAKKNKKTPYEFAVEFDTWVMFMCSDPGLWNDEAFRVVKTIGDWILKINLHHANSIKSEKFELFMNKLKEILVDRIGTQHPESFKAVRLDIEAALKDLTLITDAPEIKSVTTVVNK